MISCFALIVVFLIILFNAPRKDWGDVSQALMWHQVRKFLLVMDTDTHAKFWRPSYLLLVNDIGNHSLVEFCERSKKGGLFLIGNVMVGDIFSLAKPCKKLQAKWVRQIRGSQIKALPKVIIAPSTRLGYQFLIGSGGIGGLDFNTVVLPLQNRGKSYVPPIVAPSKDDGTAASPGSPSRRWRTSRRMWGHYTQILTTSTSTLPRSRSSSCVRYDPHPFIHPFIHSFIYSSIHLFIHSSVHSFIMIHVFIYSFIRLFIHAFIHCMHRRRRVPYKYPPTQWWPPPASSLRRRTAVHIVYVWMCDTHDVRHRCLVMIAQAS